MIPTGITKLDKFLNGGIFPKSIFDIFGESASGKTQIALQITVNCISNNGYVLFHDIKGEFRPERILEMLKAKNLSHTLLDNIDVKRIFNSSDQINSIKHLDSKYSLLIIDNVAEHFSLEYTDKEESFTKNTLFMKYLQTLSSIAQKTNMSIVLTNTIRNHDGKEVENLASAIEPFVHHKLHLRKTNGMLQGEIKRLLSRISFSYTIKQNGVFDSS